MTASSTQPRVIATLLCLHVTGDIGGAGEVRQCPDQATKTHTEQTQAYPPASVVKNSQI